MVKEGCDYSACLLAASRLMGFGPMCFSCFQIAPAEGMDAKQRMVIIVGPPEAQFKVLNLQIKMSNIWSFLKTKQKNKLKKKKKS